MTEHPSPRSGSDPAELRDDGRTTRWLGPVLLAMAASGVSQGFVRFTYPFVLPAMTQDVLGSYGAAGLLGASNLGSYLVGVLVMTAVAGRCESSLLVKVGLGMCTAGLALVAAAPSLWLLVAGMSIAGLFSAAVWIPVSSIVAAHAPPEHRALAFGLMTAGVGVSIAMSGAITSVVQEAHGDAAWRQVWAAEGVLAAVLLALLVRRLKPMARPSGTTATSGPDNTTSRPKAARLCLSYGVYGVSFSVYTSFRYGHGGAGHRSTCRTTAGRVARRPHGLLRVDVHRSRCRHNGLTGAGLGRRLWPGHGLFGHVNVQNNRQNGHTTPLSWSK